MTVIGLELRLVKKIPEGTNLITLTDIELDSNHSPVQFFNCTTSVCCLDSVSHWLEKQ